jgi:SH3-like domain-containing protein
VKRRLLIAIPLLILVAVLAWIFRPRHESLGSAYVCGRNVILWNSVAQVRQAITTVHFGEKVEILGRRNDNARVRAASGATGWLDVRLLMEPALWQRSVQLVTKSQGVPVQARGRTKVSTNLRIEPGRTASRLYQFGRGVPVEIIGRAVADRIQAVDEKDSDGEAQGTKKEDWFLVRAIASRAPGEVSARGDSPAVAELSDPNVPVAGWVVSRFVELDLPVAVREGMASANMRTLAWFELNRVADPTGEKPQYLVAGTHGPEGHPCDFTTLRVYTWHEKKSRYETAFIENRICGALPVIVDKGPKGEPQFRFHSKEGDKQERVYRLMQTVVRRVRENERPAAPQKRSSVKSGRN